MTDTSDDAATDPFVTQVGWLIASAGGRDQLVTRSGGLVSARTLDNWMAGSYPRTKVTGAVRELDAWARAELPGYPEAAGVPALVDSCGPYRGASAVGPATADDPVEETPAGPAPRRRRLPTWALPAVALVLVAVLSSALTALVLGERSPEASAADPTLAANDLVDVPLPSTGDGTPLQEEAGSIGANTFADPRTLSGRGAPIPPHTTIMVRCRYYAPSVPSVSPDGFWYLIETEPWNGLWTPANSYMNGDPPGGPYLHNTDLAVPVCR
ncbi:hypothetical protein SAMN04515665_11638 [Blastococcus sp. DSM 46786]|uniref:hypothetical protein n=1 Tax=Blastococcus sp. DSM 46786 TaxID=1798227 RepID=UPI0008BCD0A7|nr:hypothetical protein [Blastococcus sp. DSM 46786]SEL64610.1 hypothetical protein SAMN04515665_11638 [Blastococcus sp. DSM 46786]